MRFDVLTLFPDLFGPHLQQGITRRAFAQGQVDVRLWPLRDFADGSYRRVDDRPYGGGPGMVMLAEPLQRALAAVRADRARPATAHLDAADAGAAGPDTRADPGVQAAPGPEAASDPAPLILFTPTGERLTQALVHELAAGPGAILLCGRYEGIDQRFIDRHVQRELSLGDFVLSGGELPALVLLDAVARLQPGVLTPESHAQDSFEAGLLDCPHYSRPEQLALPDGGLLPVPPVLLSGHHGQIARWRREQQLALTARRRPDLIAAARAQGRLSREDERFLRGLGGADVAPGAASPVPPPRGPQTPAADI